jgi:hypothetical protein
LVNAKQQPFVTVELGKVVILSTRKDDAETIDSIGLVLCAPLVSVLYSAYGDEIQAAVMIPIALYQGVHLLGYDSFLHLLTWKQGTQFIISQFSVIVMRRWVLQGEDPASESESEKDPQGDSRWWW